MILERDMKNGNNTGGITIDGKKPSMSDLRVIPFDLGA